MAATATMAQNTLDPRMEKLDRGLIVMQAASGTGNFISWRMLGSDDEDRVSFDLLRNGSRIAQNRYATNYSDASGTKNSRYQVVTKIDGEAVDTSAVATTWGAVYKKIVLDRPAAGQQGGTYDPNDCSVGDVDGDGEYEIFVKWYPSNAKDNSQSGITDITLIDCYKMDGTRLWRIDLGRNIRSGAHYTQFMVYDFDGDGRAEMMCKTGPGSLDGKGRYVNQAATDATIKSVSGTALYRSSAGRITGGQEWLTVFSGLTGEALHTIFYNPNRNMTYGGAADGSVNWGVGGKNDTGSYGNRGERYLAAVAHLAGPDQPASGIFCRGYYDYAFIWAVDFDGQQLHQRWLCSNKAASSYSVTTYDANGKGTTKTYSNLKPTSGSGSGTMYQNGNHNMSVADVDGDGRDEIIWGSAACDDDGTVMYGTGYGHGDAMHLADHCPDRPGLEVFQIHEGGSYGWDLHDARTGEILYSATGGSDNGRGLAGNFDSATRGSLFWSSNDGKPRSAVTGQTVYQNGGSSNFRVFWDGDLQEELLDGSKLDKFNSGSGGTTRLFTIYNAGPGSTCNGTKNTPNLQADIFGDWREEIILYSVTDEESCLAIYSSNIATNFRLPTLMHDNTYRKGIAWQNTAYNQPPHLGYYLPDALKARVVDEGRYDIAATVGDTLDYETKVRYAKSVLYIACFLPDGTRKGAVAPDGFSKPRYTIATRTIGIAGRPQMEGDYKFVFKLTGIDSEVVYDTLVVRAQNTTGIVQAVANYQLSTVSYQLSEWYDLQGRRLQGKPATPGLYIHRGKKVVIK